MATVKLENIYKSFGETEVLFDINLEINDKEFVVMAFQKTICTYCSGFTKSPHLL